MAGSSTVSKGHAFLQRTASMLQREFDFEPGTSGMLATVALLASAVGGLVFGVVALAVIGESGSPALASVRGTLYVGADADDATIHRLWGRTCAHAPVFATLRNATPIDITIQLVP